MYDKAKIARLAVPSHLVQSRQACCFEEFLGRRFQFRLKSQAQLRCFLYKLMHSLLECITKARNRQVHNVMRLNVLDNSTIRSTDDERHTKFTTQESIQVARQNPVRVG